MRPSSPPSCIGLINDANRDIQVRDVQPITNALNMKTSPGIRGPNNCPESSFDSLTKIFGEFECVVIGEYWGVEKLPVGKNIIPDVDHINCCIKSFYSSRVPLWLAEHDSYLYTCKLCH